MHLVPRHLPTAVCTAVAVALLTACTSAAPEDPTASEPTATATQDAGPAVAATPTPAPTPTSAEPTPPEQDEADEKPADEDPTDDAADDDARPPAAADLARVEPFVSYAGPGEQPGTIEVAGYVPMVIERGGTCTATLTGTSVTASAPAWADATSTSCGLVVLPAEPAAGQSVVLSYTSATSAGQSAPAPVATS